MNSLPVRKTPYKHKVRAHLRSTSTGHKVRVSTYQRGKGKQPKLVPKIRVGTYLDPEPRADRTYEVSGSSRNVTVQSSNILNALDAGLPQLPVSRAVTIRRKS